MVMMIALGAFAAIAGLYTLGAATMLIGGLLLCPGAVRRHAAEIETSFTTALLLGALLWPIMGRKPWTGPLL